jgi:lipid-A-disaccharide synthase
MKILLLAGEESGLIYANRLKELLAGHEIRGYADYGFKTADLAVMGFMAVISRIGYFLNVKKTMERAIDDWKPDVVCTIDYPGMNLKLAAYAKKKGVRTVHVVCPQVWAWKAGRIPKIEASLDRLCCFFPFEPALFRSGFAEFVGHPLVEEFKRSRADASVSGRVLALLPGSRLGEIERNLPVMLETLSLLAVDRAVIPAANERAREKIDAILASSPMKSLVEVRPGGARELLLSARAALVASGTATLEAALARCPTVLVYRVSPVLAWIARRVIKGIRHVGLANIIWEKSGGEGVAPMPELLQEDFTAENAAELLRPYLDSDEAHREAARRLDAAVKLLDTGSSAFSRIVSAVGCA